MNKKIYYEVESAEYVHTVETMREATDVIESELSGFDLKMIEEKKPKLNVRLIVLTEDEFNALPDA